MSPDTAEDLLKQADKEGCFVIRNSSTCPGRYSLSLYTKVPDTCIRHYRIGQNDSEKFYLFKQKCFRYIPDLINYYRHNKDGLISKLESSPSFDPVPPVDFRSHNTCQIKPSQLELFDDVLGEGAFGVVKRGRWLGTKVVAVKMMREGAMSEEEFIDEAEAMTLQHENLVRLLGVCTEPRPIYIVTEYMQHGSLHDFLRRYGTSLNVSELLKICKQVWKGMAYLESKNYVHRDLAARNCLVGSDRVVKVSDFGLTRYTHDQYVSQGAGHPIRWEPPEVLTDRHYSSKSDVWAYGVLMWEVFTCGEFPYCELDNDGVEAHVMKGYILGKPLGCPEKVYNVMRICWSYYPNARPSFSDLERHVISMEARLEHPAAPPSDILPVVAGVGLGVGVGAILLGIITLIRSD